MRMKSAAETLLFSVAALALSACSDQRQEPAPKTAVSTEIRSVSDAKKHFFEQIDWTARPGARATLYTDLLKSGDVVGERGYDAVHHSRTFEWFALVDLAPGAYFRHPLAYSFMSFEAPKVTLLSRWQLPTVNHRPVWENTRDFLQDPEVLHSDCWLDKPPAKAAGQWDDALLERWPPRMATDRCKNEKRAYAVLAHNLEDLTASPETIANLEMVAIALSANGYNLLEFLQDPATGERQPYINLAAPGGRGLNQLKNFITIHRDFNDCCEEIVFYLTGETELAEDGYRTVASFDLPFYYAGEKKSRSPAKKLFAEDLALIFDDLKTCHLNVVIDANNAAAFAADFLRVPVTESVLSACREGEFTYSSAVDSLAGGSYPDPFSTSDGERGSEFTSSLAKAWADAARDRAADNPPPAAHRLIMKGLEAALEYDLAYLGGQSSPMLHGRSMSSNCPCGIDTASLN